MYLARNVLPEMTPARVGNAGAKATCDSAAHPANAAAPGANSIAKSTASRQVG